MRRRGIVAAMALVGVAFAAQGCGGPRESPAEVVRAASEASRLGDVEELERRLDERMFGTLLRAGGGDREKLRQELISSAAQVMLKDYTVLRTTVEGDTAAVETEATFRLPGATEDVSVRGRTRLKKIEGEWRISGVEAMGGPGGAGGPRGRRGRT